MPPPVARPISISASRASLIDEKKRQAKVAAERDCRPALLTATRASIVDEKKRQDRKARERVNPAESQIRSRKDNVDNRNESQESGQQPFRDNWTKMAKIQKELQDMQMKMQSAESKLEEARKHDIKKQPMRRAEAGFLNDNLKFYQNSLLSRPSPGFTIETMLKYKGQYDFFEEYPGFIHWLFPTPEASAWNIDSQQLNKHEAQAIRGDDTTQERVLRAYKLMLDFYGMQLVSSIHGTVKRSSKGWKERYLYLNRSPHNFRRITRILKSIGELGYERLQAPWVDFLIEEAVFKKELPNLNGVCLMHWITAVKDEEEKELLYRKASGLQIHTDNTTYDAQLASDEYIDEN